MNRLKLALESISGARTFTDRLLDRTPAADWYRMPAGGVTHIAWQAGHLAVAAHALLLVRIRGSRDEDEALIPQAFRAAFGRGTDPMAVVEANWSPDRIREMMSAVHKRAWDELRGLDEAVLDEPVQQPHPVFHTKGGALFWAAQHEMYHAGQIALIRRMHGHMYDW